MSTSSKTPYFIFIFLIFHPLIQIFHPLIQTAYSDNTNFNFNSFSFHNITLLGDSYFHNGSIGLTKVTGVPSSSSGTAIYNLPVQFLDSNPNTSASFSTNFTFLISNPNPDSSGDGLTFFISSFNYTLGGIGGNLGIFNSSSNSKNNKIIAVEFDTKLDECYGDASANHVGFDVNSPLSLKVAELDDFNVDLKSGNRINAWIDYNRDVDTILVFLNSSVTKPKNPILSMQCELHKQFQEFMYVGFSASTEGNTEIHTIENWSFETFGLPKPNNISSKITHGNISYIDSMSKPEIPFTNSSNNLHKNLSFGLIILGPLLFAFVFAVIIWFSIKKQILTKCKDSGGSKQNLLNGPRKFSYKELIISTNKFHISRVIGNGAFGTVYKAIDPKSNKIYAVKRSKQSHENKSEFYDELSIIACLRHKNLVQLQGWCTEKNELLLIYEFMCNGSLDKVLYPKPESSTCSNLFTWERRYNVAAGMASVLTYLHQECDQRVIHRDIKSSNIMLDAGFNPRLGDFGLARLMDHNKSPVSTLTAGTMGYLAPEYLQYGKYTEKTDVFSYGVVVLEVCCGRRPIDKEGGKLVNLVDYVWGLYRKDMILEAVDERLNGEFDEGGMRRLLLLGLSCVNPISEDRPCMRRIVQILNGEKEVREVPKVKPLLMLSSSASIKLLEIDCEGEGSENVSTL